MDNSGFDERLAQAQDNNSAVQGLNQAQAKGREQRDSNVLRKNSALADAKRDKKSGLDSSKSSNNVSNTYNNLGRDKNSKASSLGGGGSSRNKVEGNKGANTLQKAVAKKNPVAGMAINSLAKKQGDKKVPGITTAGRIVNALHKGKQSVHRGVAALNGQASQTDDAGEDKQDEGIKDDDASKEVEQVTLTLSKRVIRVLIIMVSILPILFIVLLAALIMTDTIQKLVLKMVINGVFNQGKSQEEIFEDSAADIDENGQNSGEINIDDDAFIIRKDFKIYLKENDEKKLNFSEIKSAGDIDLSGVKDYYKLNCNGEECEKEPAYIFYRKMYDIYFLYKYKYNVKIDLALLAATLDYNAVDMDEMLKRNASSYDVNGVRENDYKNDNITDLDWEFDYKKIDGYSYLNANDYRYDMQILAKNMVTKKISYSCSGGISNSDSTDDGAANSSNIITDNLKKGNGWNSITTVNYANGIERTYRNYKQFNNGNNNYWNYPYWGGNIANSGCAPTSMAIVLSGYGYDYNPRDVVKKMNKIGIYSSNYDNIVKTLKSYNIDAEIKSWNNNSEKEIKENFANGRPIIAGVPNHFVTYVGLKDGKLIISDPGKNDGQDGFYGATIAELKNKQSSRKYILIKSNGNASTVSSSVSNYNKENKTKSGAGKVIKKSNYNGDGGYSGIYESRVTGKRFKEYKQNSTWAINKFPNVRWKEECGKISALTIGSGYSNNATYSNLYNNVLKKGSSNSTVHGIIDLYTKTNADFQSMISISELKKYLNKGYVASIHVSGYPRTPTHYLSILDINEKNDKIYISDPWGGTSYNGWKDINIVNKLKASEICLVSSDGKVISNLDNSSSAKIAENKVFYIGDSWVDSLKSYKHAKSPNSYFYAKVGMNADWVLKNYSSATSDAYNGKSLTNSIPNDVSAIVINFGLNNPGLWEQTQKLADMLSNDYKDKPIFILAAPHVRQEYSEDGINGKKFNSSIDNYNTNMKNYCSSNSNVFYINPTKNIVDNNGKGYLKKQYADGTYHLNASGDKVWYQDIITRLKNYRTTSTDSDNSSGDSSEGGNTAKDVEISNYDTELKCESGTLNKESIKATYELDKDKYDEFLLEYIEHKFYLKGSKVENVDNEEVISSGSSQMGEAMVKVGLAEYEKFRKGQSSARTYQSAQGLGSGQPWCAAFVSYVSKHTTINGKTVAQIVGKTSASTGDFMQHFYKTKGINFYYNDSCSDLKGKNGNKKYYPKPGDYIFFDWQKQFRNISQAVPGSGPQDHTAMVEKYENGKIHTIEGNNGNAVRKSSYDITNCAVIGYGSWY